jgi:hypothetical protein
MRCKCQVLAGSSQLLSGSWTSLFADRTRSSRNGVRAEDDLEDVPRQGSMLVLRAWRAETGVKTPETRCPAFQNVVGDREPLQILSEPSGMSRSHDID